MTYVLPFCVMSYSDAAAQTFRVMFEAEISGPFTLEEIHERSHFGFLPEGSLVEVNGEWIDLSQFLEGGGGSWQQEEEADPAHPRSPKLSLFDLTLLALLWLWYAESEWPSVGALAVCLTCWVGGIVLRVSGTGYVQALGHLSQAFGGWVGVAALLWLAVNLVQWLFHAIQGQ